MYAFLKKILVMVPVVLLGIFYLHAHAADYAHTSGRRLVFLALTLLLLYGWVLAEVLRRKQHSLAKSFIQSTFFVYIFMVLTLTGYFILFREVSAHDWWHRVNLRIDRKDRVNLELFKMFRIYRLSNIQVVGNFIMLMPLGIYLPLLYRRLSHFFPVLLVAFTVSFLIEFLQLITSFRSADVDDILLNTLGACFGYMIFAIILNISKRTLGTPGTSAIA